MIKMNDTKRIEMLDNGRKSPTMKRFNIVQGRGTRREKITGSIVKAWSRSMAAWVTIPGYTDDPSIMATVK